MPSLLLALGSILFVTIGAALIFRTAMRTTNAGINTSRLGRALTLGVLSISALRRRARRLVGRLFLTSEEREARDRAIEAAAAREIALAMGNMKGALMKIGQIVSFMDDAVPEAYRVELAKLQTQAPPLPWEVIEATLRVELGGDLYERFSAIERSPLAAASIGQVHRGTLHDGKRVAIKVQYPGVAGAISADLDNYGMLSAMLDAVTPTMDAGPIVEELRARLGEELDYTKEAQNQELFRLLYEERPDIIVPRVLREHSSRHVLVTELIEGAMGFYEFLEKASVEDKRRAVRTIYSFAYDSIYHHYVFNGDPHPGNYLFLPGGRVAFLDFGCVKRFPKEFVESLRELNRLYLLGEREAYREKMIEMRYILPAGVDKVSVDWLWEYMRYYYLPMSQDEPFTITAEYCKKAIHAMFGRAMRKLNMPGDFVLLNRISFGLNSIFARLGARENFHELARRYFFKEGDVERYKALRRTRRRERENERKNAVAPLG